MRTKKWLRQVLAQSPGWRFEGYSRNGHVMLRHDNGALWYAPGTPGRGRALANLASDLRRAARNGPPSRIAQ